MDTRGWRGMRKLLPMSLVVALLLAGCATGGDNGGAPPLNVDPDKGGIRGLVVDQAVTPLGGATVTLTGGPDAGKTTESGSDGLFNFTGLAPGDYFLIVSKPGYKGSQGSANVVAGDAQPPIVKILIERLATATPYVDHFKLDGFYSCTFALFFITDSCEFMYRTVWDGANETGNPPPAPRSLQEFSNTQYIDVTEDSFTIIQEAFWDDNAVPTFWIMIDETPIDNGCDCSPSYANRIGSFPLLNRLERFDALGAENEEFITDYGDPIGEFPLGKTVASRGFIPFQDAPLIESADPNTWGAAGVNFQFVVMTSIFHNYVPDAAWTFETRDNYPIG